MPSAGSTRPKTISSGILTTPRQNPVRTMTLSATLVNRPKNPFQSPGTHQSGLYDVSAAAMLIVSPPLCLQPRPQSGDDGPRPSNPAEDPALRLDHLQAHLLELRKVRADAILEHEAVETPVIGLAHRGVDADLGGDAADDQLLDAAMFEDRVEVGRVERALARLVDDRLAGQWVELGNDVVAGLAAHEQPAHRCRVADLEGGVAAHLLCRSEIGEVGPVAFAGVDHRKPRAARRL